MARKQYLCLANSLIIVHGRPTVTRKFRGTLLLLHSKCNNVACRSTQLSFNIFLKRRPKCISDGISAGPRKERIHVIEIGTNFSATVRGCLKHFTRNDYLVPDRSPKHPFQYLLHTFCTMWIISNVHLALNIVERVLSTHTEKHNTWWSRLANHCRLFLSYLLWRGKVLCACS